MKEKKKALPALCFVPEMLVDYVNKSNIRLLEPASFFMHGVCLLVDISGFTKLSGQFCDQGKAGIDDLQLATNGFMGQLVDIIYKFGGDIIKFAGDAIICVFSADFTPSADSRPLRRSSVGSFASFDEKDQANSPDLETSSVEYSVTINTPSSVSAEVVLRVMHCAKLLTGVKTDKLAVHVAMSCGEMCFGILGGFENRWECLISGPCIHQLSGCLDDAPSLHAVISRRCARTIKEALLSVESKPFEALTTSLETSGGKYTFSILPLPSGNYRIVEVDYTLAEATCSSFKAKVKFEWNDEERNVLVKQFVPLPIAEQLDRGSSLHYMAEIREVTTMFMKWDSYDPNVKHRDLLELQPCFYQAQRILHNTGAYLRQFLVDDKGCVLIACWGMPHLSYLDNSHRAVTAAAQIRIACYQLEMNCSFGITTGDVYCGTVGSNLRMEYAAIGSVVNMSARLMCKANGGILIDDATYNHLPPHDLSSLQKLTPIKVKGREEPLQVYSYIEQGLKHNSLKLGDDMDLPQYCRYPLSALLVKMSSTNTTNAKRKSKPDIPVLDLEPRTCGNLLRRMFRPASSTTASRDATLSIVLIEGKAGSGRTSVVTWLKNQATEYNIPTCCVRLTKKDTPIEYGMWKKLFLQLMPKDLFLNNNVQRNYVQELLRLAYPKSGRSQGFSALQQLGITCTIEDGVTRSRNAGLSEPSLRKQFAWSGSGKAVTVAENMYTIFSYLLGVHPTLVIIEGLDVADESSLELLLALGTLQSRSAVVCTALAETPELTSPVKKSKDSMFFHSKRTAVAYGKSVFAQQYRTPILDLRYSSLITLENYTPEEIDRMLCVTLGVKSVPPATSQLVQDFSGGSYFWVREILQFIKEHGAEHFLAALGESDSIITPNAGAATGGAGAGTIGGSFDITSMSSLISPRSSPFKLSGTAETSMHSSNHGSSIHNSIHSSGGSGQLQHGSMRNSIHGSIHGSVHSRPSSFMRTNSKTKSRPSSANMSSQQGKLVNFTEPIVGGEQANNPIAPSQKQLDHLLLVRFGGLLSEEQRVLRKASVIGGTFATSVLFTLLSPHLQAHLAECLKTLVQQKWIYQDLTCDHTYQFAHSHVRQLVYELTPPSERNILHQLIADHLSQTYPDDKSRYFSIWYHYQHCDTDKALQYAVKATAVMIETNDIFEYGDILELLFGSFNCCKTVYDIYVLQALMTKLQLKLERIKLTPKHSSKKGWLSRLLPASVYAHSSSMNKVAPQRGVLQRDGTVFIDDTSVDDEVRSNAHSVHSTSKPHTHKTTATTSTASTPSPLTTADATYELEATTKQHLLEQVDRFRYYLSAKSIELSAGASCGEPQDEPTLWQREMLNIRACKKDC